MICTSPALCICDVDSDSCFDWGFYFTEKIELKDLDKMDAPKTFVDSFRGLITPGKTIRLRRQD